jgi:two-component system, NtrC family, sensor histidine kinase KinB
MTFSLKQKLFTAFGVPLLITAFIGFQSIRRFERLGQSIDVILRENYRSVIACQQMKEALERIDSGILFLMLGWDKEGLTQIENNLRRFQNALTVELNNLTLPEEPQSAFLLKTLFRQYRDDLQKVLRTKSSISQEMYFNTIFPLFQRIKSSADSILQINQQNMNNANNVARFRANRAQREMYAFLTISGVIAAIFFLFSNRWILRPIHRLIDSTDEIRRGNLNLVVPVETRDEIGQLSNAFNAMTVSLRFFRRSDHAKLLRLQQSTQKAFRNLPEALAIVDAEGAVEIATESARTNFGLTPNTRISDLPHPWMTDLYQQAIKGQKPPINEYKFPIVQHFVNNQEKFYQPRAYSILDDDKKLDGLIIFLQDITLLKQSDDIKRNLLSTISHQLKTPLTSIRMAIHLLLEEKIGGLTENQAELLVSAREESERLSVILEDLLDISRIESGSVQMNLAPTSPHELVNEAVTYFRREAQEKGIELAVEIPELLPDAIADKPRIGHVLANLLANAIRYTPRGGRILLSVREDGNTLKFTISDNGGGIPEEYRQKIFEKFFRVPGQDSNTGEGLGLAISREIIRAHGGEISLESSKGPGAAFFFTLPRLDSDPKEG